MTKCIKLGAREANAIFHSGQLILGASGWVCLWEIVMPNSDEWDEAVLYESPINAKGGHDAPRCLGLYAKWDDAVQEVLRLMRKDHLANRPEKQPTDRPDRLARSHARGKRQLAREEPAATEDKAAEQPKAKAKPKAEPVAVTAANRKTKVAAKPKRK